MSDEDVAEPEAQPLTDEWHSVLSTMVAMLSLEDDMRVVSCLNERLAPLKGSPEAELGEGDDSGPTVPVPPAEGVRVAQSGRLGRIHLRERSRPQ